MTTRDRLSAGVPVALVLAAGAAFTFLPAASPTGLAVATIAAFAGGLLGARTARTPLRALVVPTLSVGLLLLGPALSSLIDRFPPALAHWPDALARVREAVVLGVPSFAVSLLLAHLAARVPSARLLPAGAVIVAVVQLLASHRGGAIHLPYEIADRAWLRGWHPTAVFIAIGVLAGVGASLALYRPGRTRRVGWAVLLLAVAAVTIVRFAPAAGLLALPSEDPLRLAGDPQGGRTATPAAPRSDGDPLGLATPRAGTPGAPLRFDDMAPFRDDYSSAGAQAPIAIVVLHDDVRPTHGVYYFRQVAFSRFNGRRLVRTLDGEDDLFARFPSPGRTEVLAPPPGAAMREVLPATVSLVRDHVLPPVIADGFAIESETNADPALFRRTYRTRSMVLTAPPVELLGRAAGNPAWPEELRSTYRETPDDPRYAALANAIRDGLKPGYRDDPLAQAYAIALWLEDNTHYSLRSKHADAADPVASFLFGDRVGYCVHLAHAATYLMRSLDLPARVAAGYAYEESDRAGGSALMLRAGDAHAWAEVYLEGIGWIPIDPSPPSIDPPLAAPDLDLQRLLGEMARPRSGRAGLDAPPPYQVPGAREMVLVAGLALLLWAGAGHAAKLWRRLAPRLVRRDPAARLALRAALDRLGEAGLVRAPGETREAFARRASGVAPAIALLTDAHLGARFGRRAAAPLPAAELARTVARDRARTAGRISRARLWWGRLDPWSWVRTR